MTWRPDRCIAARRRKQDQDVIGLLGVSASSRDLPGVSASSRDPTRDPLQETYEVKNLIGRGTYGKVYRGRHKRSGATVAIKILIDSDPDSAEAATRELDLLKRSRHDCVVPLLDSFEVCPYDREQAQAVFVYPLREGDLGAFLDRRKADGIQVQQSAAGLSVTGGPRPLDRSVVQSWAAQLASGLAFIHSHFALHRDLKPGNILLVWRGASMGVEIADFGSARLVSDKRRRLSRKAALPTQFPDLTPHVGTEPYAAPEEWFEGDYGYPGDIWSFGTIVFELLTLEMFTPGPGKVEMLACALSRLGCQDEAESRLLTWLGPLQQHRVRAAVKALSDSEVTCCRSLAACVASEPLRGLWNPVVAALKWCPEARITAKALSESLPRLDIVERAGGVMAAGLCATVGPAAMSPAELPAEPWPSRAVSTKSLAGSMDFARRPHRTPRSKQCNSFCMCSGHCGTAGHKHRSNKPGTQICTSKSLVEGCRLCVDCKCSLSACMRPKNRGDFCYKHGRSLATLPWHFRAMRAARVLLKRMTPCDIGAFVNVFGQLRTSFCCTFLAAWLKDPAAVKAFAVAALASPQGCHDGCRASADDVFDMLVRVVKEVQGPSNKAELEQTTRQGVGRFMGVRVVCRILKVVAKSPEEVGPCDGAPDQVALGLGAEKFYVAQTCPSELRSLVAACHAFEPTFQKLLLDTDKSCQGALAVASGICELLEKVRAECRFDFTTYAVRNCVRKITMSWLRNCLCDTAGPAHDFDWGSVTYDAIEESGAVADVERRAQIDIKDSCGEISAEDISELLLGRHDQALFVSMWACLFSEVGGHGRVDATKARIIGLLGSPRAEEVLDAFLQEHGVPPCPEVLVRLLL